MHFGKRYLFSFLLVCYTNKKSTERIYAFPTKNRHNRRERIHPFRKKRYDRRERIHPFRKKRYSRRERIYPFRKMPPGLYRRQIALFTIKAILQPFGGVSANVIPYSLIILIVANDMVIKRRLPQLPRM